MDKLEAREKNRLQWENYVIDYIGRGYTKGDAQRAADDRLRYEEKDEENED